MAKNLHYRSRWLAGGWLIIFLIFTASLYPHPPGNLLKDGWDKVWHAGSYALLMFWFAQLYVSLRLRIIIGLAFMAMGLLIEVMQGFSIIRTFDLNDALANSVGVVAGACLMLTPLSRSMQWFEANLIRKKNAGL